MADGKKKENSRNFSYKVLNSSKIIDATIKKIKYLTCLFFLKTEEYKKLIFI